MRLAGHVQHTAVLNIRVIANTNLVDVAPDHGVEPHTAFFPDDHIAYDLSALHYKCGIVYFRCRLFKGMNHFSYPEIYKTNIVNVF